MKSLKLPNISLTLIFLALLSLALGQLSALSKTEGTNIYLFDFVVGFTAVFNLIYLLAVKKSFYIPKPFAFLGAFVVFGAFSLITNLTSYTGLQLLSSGFYAIRLGVYLLFVLGVFNLVRVEKITKAQIYNIFIFLGIIVAVAGFVQLVILPDFTQLDPSLGWDPHKNRLASTFFDPNFVGAYLTIIFMMYVTGIDSGIIVVSKFKKYLFLTILCVAIVLTFSRSAWLMFAVVSFYYSLVKNPKLIVGALFVVFLAYYLVPRIQTRITGTTDPSDSAHFRLISWSNTLKIISDYPVTGVGFNGLRTIQLHYGFVDYDSYLGHSVAGSDSSVLFILATTGIIGLFLFISALITPLLRKSQKFEDAFIYKIILVGLFIESQFINSMFYPQILVLWLILLAFNYL